jgi:hypothetical protein
MFFDPQVGAHREGSERFHRRPEPAAFDGEIIEIVVLIKEGGDGIRELKVLPLV